MKKTFKLGEKIEARDLEFPVGEFIHPIKTAFPETSSCFDLLSSLSEQGGDYRTRYFYTVNEKGQVTGVLSTRQLLFAPPKTLLKELASQELVLIEQHAPLAVCLKLIDQHRLPAIPVTDEQRVLIGVFELQAESEEASLRDLFQLLGFHLQSIQPRSVGSEFFCRMPWLFFNIASGLGCALIGNSFGTLLDHSVVISLFIPLVLALGESTAVQSMALSLPLLDFKKVPWVRLIRRIKTEGGTAILLALGASAILALAYVALFDNYAVLGAITLSILLSVLISTQIGTFAPLILHSLKLDAKIAAGPIALTIADLCTTSIYLGLSAWVLQQL